MEPFDPDPTPKIPGQPINNKPDHSYNTDPYNCNIDPNDFTVEVLNVTINRKYPDELLGITFFKLDKEQENLVFVNKVQRDSLVYHSRQIYEGDLLLKINGIPINCVQSAIAISNQPAKTFVFEVARPVPKIKYKSKPKYGPDNLFGTKENYSTLDSDEREKDSGLDFALFGSSDDSCSSSRRHYSSLGADEDDDAQYQDQDQILAEDLVFRMIITDDSNTPIGEMFEDQTIDAYEISPLFYGSTKYQKQRQLSAEITSHNENVSCNAPKIPPHFIIPKARAAQPLSNLSVIEENIYEDPNEITPTMPINHLNRLSLTSDNSRNSSQPTDNNNTRNLSFEPPSIPDITEQNQSHAETSGYPDVMYTNRQNLLHTIVLQQKLFEQAIKLRNNSNTTGCESISPKDEPKQTQNIKLKYKIKRKRDGSRYVVRILNSDVENGRQFKSNNVLNTQICSKSHKTTNILSVLTV